MNKNKKLIHSIAILFLCMFIVLSFNSLIAVWQTVAKAYYVPQKKFTAPTTLEQLRLADPDEMAKNMPKYDSRDFNIVTKVQDQSPYNICWSYSSIAAVETALLRQGLATDNNALNLNEKNVAYSVSNRDNDPLNNTFESAFSGLSWDNGGTSGYLPTILTQWRGLVEDKPENNSYTGYEKNLYKLKNAIRLGLSSDDVTTEMMKRAVAKYGAVDITVLAPPYIITKYMNNNAFEGTNHAVTIVGWDDTISKEKFVDTPQNDGAWIVKNSWGTRAHENGYLYMSYESYYAAPIVYEMTTNNTWDNNYFYDAGITMSNTYQPDAGQNYVAMANVFEVKKSTQTKKELLKSINVELKGRDVTCEVGIYTGLNSLAANPTSGNLVATTSQKFAYNGYFTLDLDTPVELEAGSYFSVVVKVSNPTNDANIACEREYNSTYDYTYDYRSSTKSWHRTKTDHTGSTARIKAYTINQNRETQESNNIAYADFEIIKKVEFNNQEQRPNIQVKYNDTLLTANTDYTVSYSNNIETGIAEVVVVGKNGYTGKKYLSFEIVKAETPPNLPGEPIGDSSKRSMTVDASIRYFKDIVLPSGWSWVFPDNEVVLGENKLNHVKYYDDNPNHYARYMYDVIVTKTADTVPKIDISSASVTFNPANLTYTGSEHRPLIDSVVLDGKTLSLNTDYSLNYKNNIKAGTATVIIQGMGQYTGIIEKQFTIQPAQEPSFHKNLVAMPQKAKYLGDISLPSNWMWKNYDTPLKDLMGSGTTITQTIEYIGTDRDNYKNLEIEITVDIKNVTLDESLPPPQAPIIPPIVDSNTNTSMNPSNSITNTQNKSINSGLFIGIGVGVAIVAIGSVLFIVLKK